MSHWSMASDTEIAWAAGLFEGEGCIGLGGPWRPREVRLWVVSTDLDVLERFAAIAACGSITPKRDRASRRKPCWAWSCSARSDVQRVLSAFRPWLLQRRGERADEALAKMDGLPAGGQAWREAPFGGAPR
jgi:hypothetical protein